MERRTLALIPLRAVVLSLSSISDSLILFTTSRSALSGTYRLFNGEDVVAAPPAAVRDFRGVVVGNAEDACGGVPGGVPPAVADDPEAQISPVDGCEALKAYLEG